MFFFFFCLGKPHHYPHETINTSIPSPPPPQAYGKFGYNDSTDECDFVDSTERGQTPRNVMMFAGYFFPCGVIIVSYALIFYKVRAANNGKVCSTPKSSRRCMASRDKEHYKMSWIRECNVCYLWKYYKFIFLVHVFPKGTDEFNQDEGVLAGQCTEHSKQDCTVSSESSFHLLLRVATLYIQKLSHLLSLRKRELCPDSPSVPKASCCGSEITWHSHRTHHSRHLRRLHHLLHACVRAALPGQDGNVLHLQS